MQNTLLDNPLMVSSVADEAEEETTYNIIADPEQSRQTQSLFGGAGADDSGAPDLGGTATREQLQAQFEDDPYLQQTFGTFDNYMAYMEAASDMLGEQDWWNNEGVDTRTAAERVRDEEDLASGPQQS